MRLQCEHGALFWKVKRCRKCEGCYVNRSGSITGKVLSGLEDAPWKSLLTLTSRPGTPWPSIMSAWTSMIRFLRKSYGVVEYAVIKEEGSSTGMKHLHAVLVGPQWIPHASVSKAWRTRLGAFIVDIRRVSSGKVAGYVSKYVAKGRMCWAKCATFSRGWKRSDYPATTIVEGHLWELAERAPYQMGLWSGIIVEVLGWEGPCRCIQPEQCAVVGWGSISDAFARWKKTVTPRVS